MKVDKRQRFALSAPGVGAGRLAFAAVLAALVAPHWASADTIVLRNGGRISGEIVEEAERDGRDVVVIRTDAGAELVLPKSAVEGVKRDSPEALEYRQRLVGLQDTVDEHWELAEFCKEHRLSDERSEQLWAIIRLDPDHEEARRGLGYSRLNGRWTTQDQYMNGQGYVRVNNEWRLPDEFRLEAAREEAEGEVIAWRQRLRAWSDWLGGRRHDEAIVNIRNIDDPRAVVALGELLAAAESRDAKELWIESLSRIDDSSILVPLSERAVLDDDDRVRGMCLAVIKERYNQATLRFFMSLLDPAKQSPVVINRAGYALEAIGSELAVRSLIEAVVTEHKVENPTSGGQQINFSADNVNGGLGGFQVGDNQPRYRMVNSNNEGVLAALRTISNHDFRFDKDRWLQWYVQENTPLNVDLRRSQ